MDRIEKLCAERGMRMTEQRRVIARVLSNAADHPDVEELYRRASAIDPHISIATVYRTVRLLEEKGILERHDFGGGRARYEPTDHGHHYHLIDVDSGKVIEFEDAAHERAFRDRFAERFGGPVELYSVQRFGRHIRIPVLIVHDRRDNMVGFEESDAILEHVPTARRLATSGLGHRAITRDAEVIAAAVRFIQSSETA